MAHFPTYFATPADSLDAFNRSICDATTFIRNEELAPKKLLKNLQTFWKANEHLLRFSRPLLDFPPYNLKPSLKGRVSAAFKRSKSKQARCWKRRPHVANNLKGLYQVLDGRLPPSIKATTLLGKIARAIDFVAGLPPASCNWEFDGLEMTEKSLPAEVVAKILAYLPAEELATVGQVCRLFHLHIPHILVHKINSENISSRDLGIKSDEGMARFLRTYGPELGSLKAMTLRGSAASIHFCEEGPKYRFFPPCHYEGHYRRSLQAQALLEDREIEKLNLKLGSSLRLYGLPKALRRLPTDDWVWIHHDRLGEYMLLDHGPFPKITHLRVLGCCRDSFGDPLWTLSPNQFLKTICQQFPNLSHLVVTRINDIRLPKLPASLTHLTLIKAKNGPIATATLEEGLPKTMAKFKHDGYLVTLL